MTSYPTREAAEAALQSEGFVLREGSKFWSKPGKVDDWYGGYTKTSLVEVVHNRVDPQWGKSDYYTWRFL